MPNTPTNLKGIDQLANAEHIGPAETGDNIDAKRVALYDWNGVGWQRVGSPGSANASITERYDYSDSTTIYTGAAPIGTADSAEGWVIYKYDLASSADASGKVATDVSWDDRATGSYA